MSQTAQLHLKQKEATRRCKTSVTELDEKGLGSGRRGDGTAAARVTVGDVAWVVRHSCQPRSSRGVSGPMHFGLLKLGILRF